MVILISCLICKKLDSGFGYSVQSNECTGKKLIWNGYACNRRGRFSAATESTRELEHPFFSNVNMRRASPKVPNTKIATGDWLMKANCRF